MSDDEDAQLDPDGPDVSLSVEVNQQARGYQVNTSIANYERFDIAAKVTFPVPDELDTQELVPSQYGDDTFRIEGGDLSLILQIDWASSVDRAFTVEIAEQTLVKELVEGVTVELTDMDGDILAKRSDVDIEHHIDPSTKGNRSGSEDHDGEQASVEDDRTVTDVREPDDDSPAGHDSGSGTDDTETQTNEYEGRDSPGSGRTAAPAEKGPNLEQAEQAGTTDGVNTDAEQSESQLAKPTEPDSEFFTDTDHSAGGMESDPSRQIPSDPSAEADDVDAHEEDRDSTGFEWVEIEGGNRSAETDGATVEIDDNNRETESTVEDSDDRGNETDSAPPDGVLNKLRSILSK